MSVLNPTFNRLVVSLDAPESMTPSGLIIPLAKNAEQAVTTGFVEEVGPDVRDIQPGDRILFTEYAGTAVTFEGNDYVIMEDEVVHAILE